MKKALMVLMTTCMILMGMFPFGLTAVSGESAAPEVVRTECRITAAGQKAAAPQDGLTVYDETEIAVGALQGSMIDVWGRVEAQWLDHRVLVDAQYNILQVEVSADSTSIQLDEWYANGGNGSGLSNFFDIQLSADNITYKTIASYGSNTAALSHPNFLWSAFDQSWGRDQNNKDVVAAAQTNPETGKKILYIKLISSFNASQNGKLVYNNFLVKSTGPDVISGIAIKTAPKTNYDLGSDLDVSGGVLEVSYAGGTKTDVSMTADMITGYDKNTTGQQVLTVSYAGKQTTYEVTVTALTVKEIAVSTTPKTAYETGDTLDVTGGKITVTYTNDTSDTIDMTAGMVSGFNSSAITADLVLTVTYAGSTTTYSVSVVEKNGTAKAEWRVDAAPLNVEDPDERQMQEDAWAAKLIAKPETIDGSLFLKDSLYAKTIMPFNPDDCYMNLENEGYVMYEVDLNDRTVSFTIGGWGTYRNCKFIASKDNGQTWYVITDIVDGTSLGGFSLPEDGINEASCLKNIEWILTANPEKKFLLKIITDEFDTQVLYANIILNTVYNTGANTTANDLPVTVPEGYVIPAAYTTATSSDSSSSSISESDTESNGTSDDSSDVSSQNDDNVPETGDNGILWILTLIAGATATVFLTKQLKNRNAKAL